MKEQIGNYLCMDEQGNTIYVQEYVKILVIPKLSGITGKTNGRRTCATNFGWADDLEDGTYKLQDGRIVRRV